MKEVFQNLARDFSNCSEQSLRSLIPANILTLCSQVSNLSYYHKYTHTSKEFDRFQYVVYEKDYPELLTDKQSFLEWLLRRDKVPDNVNMLHAAFFHLIESSHLTVNDKIYLGVTLTKYHIVPKTLHVTYYNSVQGHGLSKEFYQTLLPNFARSLGFRFIVGTNNDKNLDFFTQKIGRVTLQEVNDWMRSQCYPFSQVDSYTTIQFLNEEDKSIYMIKD